MNNRCPAESRSSAAPVIASASSSMFSSLVFTAVPAGRSWRAAEQRAEVEAAGLDGGVLAKDVGVEVAAVGQVGLGAFAAGVEDGVGAHRLVGSAVGAAAGCPSRHDDRSGRGPCPGAVPDG